MTVLPITLLAAALAAILNIWLAVRCGQVRTKEKVSVGDGGNDAVIRRMRAHSNFVENTPFFLALVALIELAKGSGSPTWLYYVVVAYFIGRIAHAFGMDGWKLGRPIGTLTAMLAQVGLAIYALVLAYSSPIQSITPTQIELQQAEEVPQG
jgi:uncharacterized protein